MKLGYKHRHCHVALGFCSSQDVDQPFIQCMCSIYTTFPLVTQWPPELSSLLSQYCSLCLISLTAISPYLSHSPAFISPGRHWNILSHKKDEYSSISKLFLLQKQAPYKLKCFIIIWKIHSSRSDVQIGSASID